MRFFKLKGYFSFYLNVTGFIRQADVNWRLLFYAIILKVVTLNRILCTYSTIEFKE